MNKLIIKTNKKTKVIIEGKMYDLGKDEYIECCDEMEVMVVEYLDGNNVKMLFVDFALKEDNIEYPNKLYYIGDVVEIHLCIFEQKQVANNHFVFGDTMVDILGGRNIFVKIGEASKTFSFFSPIMSIKKHCTLPSGELLMLTLEDGNRYIVLSSKNNVLVEECDKIEVLKGEIYILQKTGNMLGVGRLKTFSEDGSLKKSGYVEYDKKTICPNTNTLLTYFLQCLERGVLDMCADYLSPNIKNIKIDTINAFLGDYREYYQINPQTAILTYKTSDSHYHCKKLIITVDETTIKSIELI